MYIHVNVCEGDWIRDRYWRESFGKTVPRDGLRLANNIYLLMKFTYIYIYVCDCGRANIMGFTESEVSLPRAK